MRVWRATTLLIGLSLSCVGACQKDPVERIRQRLAPHLLQFPTWTLLRHHESPETKRLCGQLQLSQAARHTSAPLRFLLEEQQFWLEPMRLPAAPVEPKLPNGQSIAQLDLDALKQYEAKKRKHLAQLRRYQKEIERQIEIRERIERACQ